MGGSFHHHHFWGDLSAWVVYKMRIIRYKRSSPQNNPQHTTNTQQQDELLPPYPQAALPSISLATAAAAPAVGSAAPYGSRAGARRLVIACHAGWFPFGTPKQTTSKNREENGALALSGPYLLATHNNQLGVGSRGRKDV
jgi:hypothetical protein